MPRQMRAAPAQAEFPDVRLRYRLSAERQAKMALYMPQSFGAASMGARDVLQAFGERPTWT
jgi:hypothetical protein